MKINWDITKLKEVYGNEKTSQPQTKPFVVPGQDVKADTKKVTWGIGAIKDVYEPEKTKKK
jgi:hypothetical protein